MFLTVFGVPTATVQLGLQLVQSLFRTSTGDFDLLIAGTLEELRDGWRGTGKRNVLYFHESPDGEVLKFFRDADVPVLLFTDDPVNVALALHSERGVELKQACRVASVSASLYEDLSGYTNLLTVDCHPRSDMSLGSLLTSVSGFFDLQGQDGLIERAAQILPASFDGERLLDRPWVAFTPKIAAGQLPFEDQVLVERYLASYRPMQTVAQVTTLIWPRELFIVGHDAARTADVIVDMTGGRRVLLQGPWCGLPRGRWSADIEFEVFGNRMGCDMGIHVVAQTMLRQGTMALPVSGLHRCSIDFDHTDPRVPVAMQFIAERGVVQGEFELRRVTLRRLVA